LVLALAIGLSASMAHAQLSKCQAGIEKNSLKLNVTIAKALNKCKDKIRKASEKGPDRSGAADACEKALKKIYALTFVGDPKPVDPAKSKIGKFRAAIQKLEDKGTCTATDLDTLGHLVSGVNAPGTGITDFMESWLIKAKEKLAWKEEVFEVGDARSLIDEAINAGENPAKACDPIKGKNCGTCCDPTGATCAANEYPRPNLCMLGEKTWPMCRDHACTLSGGSGAVLNPTGAPISLSARRVTLEVCTAPSGNAGILDPDFKLLINQPARTFQPPPVIPIVPAITVCVDQVRSEGWCDCSAAAPSAPSTSPEFCLDHVADVAGTCPDTGASLESNCACGFPAGLLGMPCNTAGCLACVNSSTGARCHSGTQNSALTITWPAVASGANDCVDLNQIQFTLEPPAICVDAMGQAVGQCNAPGSPDATCAAAGGVICVASSGADGVACTRDDLVPAGAPTTVPFTTDSATSTIEDFVAVEGICAAGQAGMNCVTNADCDTAASGPGDGVCAGQVFGCGTGPNAEDCQFTAGPGAGVSCANLESSNLAGWAIVGSFPALDGAGGIGDSILTFTLACS
jgi:hypothetical protein